MVELDLSTVVSSCSGPKRPHDRVAVTDMKSDFEQCLRNKIGFKGYAIKESKLNTEVPMEFGGEKFELSHGKVLWPLGLYVQTICLTECSNIHNNRGGR